MAPISVHPPPKPAATAVRSAQCAGLTEWRAIVLGGARDVAKSCRSPGARQGQRVTLDIEPTQAGLRQWRNWQALH